MAGLDATGFTSKTFEEIRQEIDDYQKQHISAGLDLTDDSPDGQINASVSLQVAKIWEVMQALVASLDPDQASAWTLEQRAKLTGTTKTAYSKSLIIGQVTLDPNQNLPVGSIANLNDKPNIRFVTTVEVPSDPVGGTFDVIFEAENDGVVQVDVGELDEINVAVTGWLSVNNSAIEYYTGTAPEEDPEFRLKRERELAASGSATLDAIIADVSQAEGVVAVTGIENPSPMPSGILPPHSINLVVRGGTDQVVGQAIFDSRAGGGAGTTGDTSAIVTDSQNIPHTVRWSRDTALSFFATITVTTEDGWAGNEGLAEIKTKVKEYIDSLTTGHDVILGKVKAAAEVVAGVYQVTVTLIDFSSPGASATNLVVARTEYVTCDVLDLTVSASAHVGDL